MKCSKFSITIDKLREKKCKKLHPICYWNTLDNFQCRLRKPLQSNQIIEIFDVIVLIWVRIFSNLVTDGATLGDVCYFRIGLSVIQRNIRKWLGMRDWVWWKLYVRVSMDSR